MNLNDIRAFVALAESGSVQGASRLLHVTQPAMTRRLQNLEAALAATLLDRSTKPPRLTPAGRLVLEKCRTVLRSLEGVRTAAAATEFSVELRIGVAHGIADVALATPLDSLRRGFARLVPVVTADWTRALVEKVRAGELDAAAALMPKAQIIPRDVVANKVGDERVVVVAPRALSVPRQARLSDLAAFSWVTNPEGCGYRAALQKALAAKGEALRVAVEVVGKELQLSLVARGLGLGLMPAKVFGASRHRRNLRVIELRDFTLEIRVVVLRAAALGHLAAAVDHFEAALAQSLAGPKHAA
jgi:DNA-binding transcriptional LysR family regulator